MGKFNLGGAKPKLETVPFYRIINGSYQCQSCDEYVHSARYLPDTAELVWRCTQEHISFIKEFYI